MKTSEKLKVASASIVLILGLLAAGWADNATTSTSEVADYYVECVNNSEECSIKRFSDGSKVSNISFDEAGENNMFSHPDNIQIWLDQNPNAKDFK